MSDMRVISIFFSRRNVRINKKKQVILKNMKLSFIPLISMHGAPVEQFGVGSGVY